MKMLSISHIINPVLVDDSSDLKVAQPITFESMRVAKENADGKMNINHYAAVFPEDSMMVPDNFVRTRFIDRSMKDIVDFDINRKLPLIKDILDRLYEISNDEYFIYTNVDIALMPHFYLFVQKIIESGYDGFVITRRTISAKYPSTYDIPFMYSEIGKAHPGFDCFIFKREFYPKFILGNVCVGIRGLGRILLWNVITHASKFEIFRDLHLTFHVGDTRIWAKGKDTDYDEHNTKERIMILKLLHDNYDSFKKVQRLDLIGKDLKSYFESNFM